MPEMTISRFAQCAVTAGTAVNSTRSSRTNPAALEPTARNAVVGVGRTLINIRRPDLERKRGNLESEADQHQQHAEQENFVVQQIAAQRRRVR